MFDCVLELDQHIFKQVYALFSAGSLNFRFREARNIPAQGNAILEHPHPPDMNRVDGPQFKDPTIERKLSSRERPGIHEIPPSADVAEYSDFYRIGTACTWDIFERRLAIADLHVLRAAHEAGEEVVTMAADGPIAVCEE